MRWRWLLAVLLVASVAGKGKKHKHQKPDKSHQRRAHYGGFKGAAEQVANACPPIRNNGHSTKRLPVIEPPTRPSETPTPIEA
ncbi:unnamed protein product, partial [Iphiclides podalirius]